MKALVCFSQYQVLVSVILSCGFVYFMAVKYLHIATCSVFLRMV